MVSSKSSELRRLESRTEPGTPDGNDVPDYWYGVDLPEDASGAVFEGPVGRFRGNGGVLGAETVGVSGLPIPVVGLVGELVGAVGVGGIGYGLL